MRYQSRIGRRRRHKAHKQRFRLRRIAGLYRPKPKPFPLHKCILVGGTRDGGELEIRGPSRRDLIAARHETFDLPDLPLSMDDGRRPIESMQVRAEVYRRTTEWAMQSIIPPRRPFHESVRMTNTIDREAAAIASVQVLQPQGDAPLQGIPERYRRLVERMLLTMLGLQ
mgnify:FL=1